MGYFSDLDIAKQEVEKWFDLSEKREQEPDNFSEILKELQVYQWHLEVSGGEITPEIESIERWLTTALKEKTRAISYVLDRLNALAEADSQDAKRF